MGRGEDARPRMINIVKTRSHRIVSLVARAVPVAALVVLVEQSPAILAVGPKLF